MVAWNSFGFIDERQFFGFLFRRLAQFFRFDLNPPSMHQAGFNRGQGFPELNADPAVLAGIADALSAFRQGAGPEMGLHLDVNFNFKTDGFIKVARVCEPFNLAWLELDSYDPEGLRLIRDRARMPIASWRRER